MLELDSELIQALANSSRRYFLTISLDFLNEPFRATNASYDYEFEGYDYSASGGLKQLTPPKIEAGVSRDLFGILLTDPLFEQRDRLVVESIGVPTKVEGHIEVASGFKPLVLHTGTISSFASRIEADEHLVEIECSGPFTKLQQTVNRMTTDSSQQAAHPGDTSMNKVYDSENVETMKWGGSS